MKQFLTRKEKGFFCSVAAIVLLAVGLVFYRMLTAVSFETTERPIVVILAAFTAILFSLIATYKDYGKVPSIIAYAASVVAFFTLLEGRASYLAFFFSGDVMNTGLSPFMIAAFVCFLLGMIAALFAVIFEEDKNVHPAFTAADWKIVLPMICVVGVLATFVGLNTNANRAETAAPAAVSAQAAKSSDIEASPSDSNGQAEAVPNYKKPNTSEEVWQEYSAKDFANEDVSGKAISYQLTGHSTIQAGETREVDTLVNLFENGEAEMTVYAMGHVYRYFGYWTNVNDENLWFCTMYYTVLDQGGKLCTIDYGYDLTGHFDDVTVNIALGLADGGQFVRQATVGGDGEVRFSSATEWGKSLGADIPEHPTYQFAEEANSAPAETTSDKSNVLFRMITDADSFVLELLSDCTYHFAFTSMNIEETGTWEWKDWTLTLTTPNGKIATAKPEGDDHALNLQFIPDISEKLVRDYTVDAQTWGTAFSGTGNYTPAA